MKNERHARLQAGARRLFSTELSSNLKKRKKKKDILAIATDRSFILLYNEPEPDHPDPHEKPRNL